MEQSLFYQLSLKTVKSQLMLIDPVPHRCKSILQRSQETVLSIASNEASVISLKTESKE